LDRVTLFASVLAETHREDKEPELPEMLEHAEARIARELRCDEMSDTETLDTSSGSAPLPADFLGIRAAYDADGPLQQVGLMEYRTATGQRRTYTIVNRNLLARVASVDIDYYARPAPMTADGSTTAILDAHPDLYVALLSFYLYKRTQDLELMQTADVVCGLQRCSRQPQPIGTAPAGSGSPRQAV
jgi:hypothetical protein